MPEHDRVPNVVTVHECPHCGFQTKDRAEFTHERQRRHGGDTVRCPDCDRQVRMI